MTKVENRKMDSSFEIYMALYQQLTDGQGMDIFKQFSEDFFDLIIVDECHRGSVNADKQWHDYLGLFYEYFVWNFRYCFNAFNCIFYVKQ